MLTLQKVKELWGQWSWLVFAIICIILATVGTVAGGRVTLICAGVGIITAHWMHQVWSGKIKTPPMTVWTLLKGVTAITAMTSCTVTMWGYIDELPKVSTSTLLAAVRWGEYGLGVALWLSGLFVLIWLAWHLLRLAILHSLK